nr:hypothetical protein [Tanacetum cinerariifolium]
MTESPLVDSGFAVPVFSPRDNLIACLNKTVAFLTAVASSRSPSTNNQLRTSSNPRNHATIQDDRVIVQQVQGRQGQSYSGTGYKSNATSSRGKHCKNAAWYKDKAMLTEAQEAGQILDEEQLAFLADLGVPDAVLMANISNYGSDVISEVPHSKTYLNDMENQKRLILEEVSQSKMSEKEKDPEAIKQKISNKPIDYVKLNKLYEDIGKCFVPQQELLADEVFWYHMLNPSTKSSSALPVKIEAPKELPKFDPIKKTRVRTKEHSDSLIDKPNLKSAKNKDLKAQIQEKVFVITSLKNDLQKLKGKEIVDIAAQTPFANTIVPGMFKLDLDPLAPKLLRNREAHIDYLKYTQEQVDILRGIVEQAKAKNPLDNALDFACKHVQRIQYVTCICSRYMP